MTSRPPCQEAAQQALVGLPPQGVVEPSHGFRHERVGVGAGLWLQVDLLASVEEFPNLIQGLQPVRVESHDHPPMILDPAPVQACLLVLPPWTSGEVHPLASGWDAKG